MKILKINKIDYNGTTYNLHVKDNHNYFANDVCVSNCHKSKASSMQKISQMCLNATIRLGVTGTLPSDIISQMILEGTIGQATRIVSSKQLIAMGLATETKIQPIYLLYNKQTRKDVKRMQWAEEDKFFRELESRNDFITRFAKKLSKTGNTILLTKNKDIQKILIEKLKKIHDNVHLVSGDVKADKREEIRNMFATNNDMIVVATVSIMGTGVNIKNLKNIVFVQMGKAEIIAIQSIGRVMRLHDSKDVAMVWDIVDDARYYTRTGTEYPNYRFKHFLERLQSYHKYEFCVEPEIRIKLEDDLI